jgi:translation initiation factor IF-2
MAKKRVYEMAKELGLSNKELVEKLQGLGFDVRSHSSSLEEVEAEAAVARIRGGNAAPQVEAKPKPAAGVGVVRRRRKVSHGETQVVTETRIVPGQEAADEEVVRTTERPEEVPVEAEAMEAEFSPGIAAEMPEYETAAEAHAEQEAVEGDDVATEVRADAGATEDAEAAEPGAGPEGNGGASEGESISVATRLQEPTSTQAVVVRRAAIAIKPKVPPAPRAGAGGAPGRRIGPVKEYQVVTDAQGRGREFVDVTKDKAGAGAKKKPAPGGVRRAKEAYSKTELLSLARERAFIPVRGRKKRPTKKGKKTEITQAAAHKRVIKIEETIQVAELAKQMGVKLVEVIRKLMQMGAPATATQSIDIETATLVAQEFEFEVRKVGVELEDLLHVDGASENGEVEVEGEPRSPVVTVMGHVDHGKTSLLDHIRKAKVAAGEAGGITQHIGAYAVPVGDGSVTFLDTPGHEAFTAMRARGAQVTDLVILVVAADDSIMPQTVEAINHAKASEVPIVVAVNKIDLPQANRERVRQGLTEHALVPEEWGGDTIVVDVSAKTGEGIDKLLEMVLLQAEVLDLRARADVPAQGVVVEAKVEKGRGPVATVLVKEGTLRRGDIAFTGTNYGKIRAMLDDQGKPAKEAGPSTPVEILGLDGVPSAGETFYVVQDEKAARELAERNAEKERTKDMAGPVRKKATLEDLFSQMKEGEQKDLPLVVKADVQGSIEAVTGSLEKLSGPKAKVRFLHQGVGAISESDVMLAAASNAIIIGFSTKPDAKAKRIAEHEGVQIRTYNVIYDAVNDVKAAMEGLLEPIRKENDIGRAEVRDVFRVSGKGTIAGCAVVDGKFLRGAFVRVLRGKDKVFDGKIDGLKRFKDDVKEVASGFECGVSIANFNDVQQGDVLEAYEVEEIRQTL